MEDEKECLYILTTNEGDISEGKTLFEVISGLPLFNDFYADTLEELLEIVYNELSIDDSFKEAIKIGDVKSLKNIWIDDYINIVSVETLFYN